MNEKEKPTVPAMGLDKSSNVNDSAETHKCPDDLFPAVKPWPEPVDGAKLIADLHDVFVRYLSLPDGVAEMLPYWVLHTYNPQLFYYTPRLCIYSPVPRCGKSQLLQLLEMTTFRSLNVSNITSAGMFRAIDAMHPTLLVDEADTYMNGDQAMRGVVNAGYKRGGTIIRNVESKGNFIPKRFNCFAPMAIAGIGMRDDTIMDRGIAVIMRRRKSNEQIEKLRPDALEPHTEQLRAQCMRFMADNADNIAKQTPKMPQFLNDRSSDIWEPLFCIAATISPDHVLKLTCATARLATSADNDDAETLSVQLLADIRHVFAEIGCDFIATTDLLRWLYQLDNRPWHDKQYGQLMLNSIKLANMLRDFQIRPVQVRVGKNLQRGYKQDDFKDAFERYLLSENRDSVTTQVAPDEECNGVTDCSPDIRMPEIDSYYASAQKHPPMNKLVWQTQNEPDWSQIPENLSY